MCKQRERLVCEVFKGHLSKGNYFTVYLYLKWQTTLRCNILNAPKHHSISYAWEGLEVITVWKVTKLDLSKTTARWPDSYTICILLSTLEKGRWIKPLDILTQPHENIHWCSSKQLLICKLIIPKVGVVDHEYNYNIPHIGNTESWNFEI